MDLSDLNNAQREAVTLTEGPLMILAGAGSGKTRTLVSRMIYLLEEKKVSPFRMLAVTFSNKAAKEMAERVSHVIKEDIGSLSITTFHSFCARLLRSEATYLGIGKNFTIYDDSESKTLVKAIMGRRGISQKDISPFDILYFIDEIKNIGHYDSHTGEGSSFKEEKLFYSLYLEYEAELRKANALDFGGLIVAVLELFHKFPDVLARYQDRFHYLLVDEYQDTNRAQFELITLLAQKRRNICVVGDEDQSIYSWRGADIRNIFDFEKFFPEANLIKLEQNYRSSKSIISAATSLISKNKERKGKKMWTDNDEGEAVTIVEAPTEKEESNFVATQIGQLSKQGTSLDDIAIFYRTNAQSRQIEDALKKLRLPYRIVGGIRFYDRKEIKDLLSYMRMFVNKKDSLAFSRIINLPSRGIGATTLKRLEDEAIRGSLSLFEMAEVITANLDTYKEVKLSAKVKHSFQEFFKLYYDIEVLLESRTMPSVVAEKIYYESGYASMLQAEHSIEAETRIENIEEFFNAIKDYEKETEHPTLAGFLEVVTLNSVLSDSEEKDENIRGEISLITVHGSKGLEFPYVFLTGSEENLFPSYQSIERGESGLEEERRLFYVAMTRAMKKLWIIFAQGRYLFGQVKFNGPTRFIDEIDSRFYNWKRLEREENPYWNDGQSSYNQESPTNEVVYKIEKKVKDEHKFPKGTRVKHNLYGEGIILESTGVGSAEKVLIKFYDGTTKRFIASYAHLTKV